MMNQPDQSATGYFDSSALVKRYLVETGTPWIQTLCNTSGYTIAVAEIGLVEIAAAFAGKLRGNFITAGDYASARADMERDAQEEYVLVAVDRMVINKAIDLTSR